VSSRPPVADDGGNSIHLGPPGLHRHSTCWCFRMKAGVSAEAAIACAMDERQKGRHR
jgi:hypothetical protein